MEGQAMQFVTQGIQMGMQVMMGSMYTAPQLMAMVKAIMDREKTSGLTTMKDMLKRDESLEFVKFPQHRFEEFKQQAKKYDLLYSFETDNAGGTTIVFRSRDMSKFDHIVEVMGVVEREEPQQPDYYTRTTAKVTDVQMERDAAQDSQQAAGQERAGREQSQENADRPQSKVPAATVQRRQPVKPVISKMQPNEIKAILGGVHRGQGETVTPQNWQAYLEVQALLYDYSKNNRARIRQQNPEASLVMSKSRWKELGRDIAPEAEGLEISMPVKTVDGSTAFMDVRVYDVAETYGREIELGAQFQKLDNEALDKLSGVIESRHNVEYSASLQQDALFDPASNTIYTKYGLDSESRFKALQREAIHAQCFKEQGANYAREDSAILADSVTYSLSTKYGINAQEYSFEGVEPDRALQARDSIAQAITDISGEYKEIVSPKQEKVGVLDQLHTADKKLQAERAARVAEQQLGKNAQQVAQAAAKAVPRELGR